MAEKLRSRDAERVRENLNKVVFMFEKINHFIQSLSSNNALQIIQAAYLTFG